MANFLVILICLLAGLLLRQSQKIPASTPHVLNTFVIYLAYPAVVLIQAPALLRTLSFNDDFWILASMAWIQFGLAFVLFTFLGRIFGWHRATLGALILTAGLGNTSFVGFPMLEAFFGSDGIKLGVVVDQAGSFLVVSTVGLITASIYAGGQITLRTIAKRIFYFPPFISLLISFALVLAGAQIPAALTQSLEKIGATLVPMALVSVGFQLKIKSSALKIYRLPLSLGLAFKLLFVPILLGSIYIYGLDNRSLSVQVTIIEAAMAPMITGAIIANEFNLDSDLANLMVGIGIPVSLLTAPGFYWWASL